MLRNLFCVLAALITLSVGSCKKDLLHWQKVQQLNSNTTCKLNHLRFVGNNICIAAGGIKYDQSEMVRSTDGGYTWSARSDSNAPKEMLGMEVAPNGKVYLCGIDGEVLRSNDSGKTWQFKRVNNWLVNLGCAFPVPNRGIFVSSVLQRACTITSVDSNFNIIDQQNFPFGLNNIYMVSPSSGYVIGYGTVMQTTDTGKTWNFMDVNGDNFMAMDIHGMEVWMCGYNGSIYHTTNGGASWQRVRNGNDISLPRYNLLDIVFKDSRNGWAVCDDGKVIRTDDAGLHWEEYDRFTTSALRSIAICPNGDLLVAGDNGGIFRITAM